MLKSLFNLSLIFCSGAAAAASLSADPADPGSNRFNELYYMQQHNTQDYGTHLTDWLDFGFGAIELDIIDRGQWENEEYGPYVSHSMNPGNKNCSNSGDTRLGHCLDDITQWIDTHHPEYPIVLLVDLKVSWDPLNAWNSDEVGMIDEWIRHYLGDRQYRFSDYLQNYLLPKASVTHPEWVQSPQNHVREMTREYGWPMISELQGKVIVVLTGGKLGSKNQNFRSGWNWLWNQRGVYPSSFMCPEGSNVDHVRIGGTLSGISTEESQRFICNNMEQAKHYQSVANTVSDNKQIMHLWGTSPASPDSFEYNYAAVAHGVQIISREKESPQQHETWLNSIPLVGARRSLPGYFQLYNASSGRCMAVRDNRYENGTPLVNSDCNNSTGQRFVYTAESQLRPQGNSEYCVDIAGGSAGEGSGIHLWDCDGGDSELWSITPQGNFVSHSNKESGYCLNTNTGASPTQYHTASCDSSDPEYRFELRPVPQWPDTSQ